MIFVLLFIVLTVIILIVIPRLYLNSEEKKRFKQDLNKVYNKINESKTGKNEYEVTINVPDGTEQGFNIAASRFDTENPKAVVYVVHGALEHRGRYKDFINFLNSKGFAAVSADCRGHGKSVNDKYPKGYMKSLNEMLEDMYEVTEYIKAVYPGLDIYMFAHSMGSIFARHYLAGHDLEIKKLVLSGVVAYRLPAPLGVCIADTVVFYQGKYAHSSILASLNGMEGEDRSWISKNMKNLEKIKNDTLIIKSFTNMANKVVFEANMRLNNVKHYKAVNPSLKILCISGAEDISITGGEKGLAATVNSLKSMGYKEVRNIVYPDMKHEVLNEKENIKVYNDVAEFYNS